MSLAIPPITPAVATLAADLGVALQPGTVVTAQVLQVLDANLVRIAIANLTIDVATVKPLQLGQALQLEVSQSASGLSLTPIAQRAALPLDRGVAVVVDDIPLAPRAPVQPAAVEPLLTPAEVRAVAVAAQASVTKQAGLSPLFANLSAAVASGTLPPPVLLAAAQLLGLRLPISREFSGGDIKTALQSSGLILEASLAVAINLPPDIKSMLLVLRQALATWLGPVPDTLAPSQGKSAPFPPAVTPATTTAEQIAAATDGPRASSVQSAAATWRALGAATEIVAPAAGTTNLLAAQLIAGGFHEPDGTTGNEALRGAVPPPLRGALPSPQPVAAPSLPPDAEPSTMARQLIADTDGALARQTLLQIASLPDRADAQLLRTDPAQPRWNFEIPFITPQGTAMAQFEIARDGSGSEIEAKRRVWRARFSLDIEPAGPVHALIAFAGDITSVKMWAERPATAAQLRANVGELGRSFDRAALTAGDIVVADGAPARPKSPTAGHFLNRAT